jgi:carbamoyl-phosphate synthase large subunit
VIPWSDDEVEVISYAASAFKQSGIAILCGSFQSISRTVDKGTMLKELKGTDIPIAEFEIASTPESVESAAIRLGYPKNPIVVKPRRSTCGKGLWILDPNIDLMQPYPGQRVTLSALVSLLEETRDSGKKIPDYVVMQFLRGEDYSVDALADAGKPIFVIPRRRVKTIDGISQVSEVVDNQKVRSTVARIIRQFNLHLNINVQLLYPVGSVGEPLVYEINPRISGTIVANAASGVDLLYYGILLALGKTIAIDSSLRIQRTRMARFWSETYTHMNEWFSPYVNELMNEAKWPSHAI